MFTGKTILFDRQENGSSRSNLEWVAQLEKYQANDGKKYHNIYFARTNGKYKGAGLMAVQSSSPTSSPAQFAYAHQILCFERIGCANILFDSSLKPGDYCEKILQSTQRTYADGCVREYKLPY